MSISIFKKTILLIIFSEKASSLLMWTEEEIDWFVDRLNKQVFNSQSGISLVASCVSSLR